MDIFALDYDAILTAMYALPLGTESACSLCVLPDPGIESAALGASESALPGNVPAEALHTFTLDSGASRCFFHDNTTLTPLSAPIPVRLADPSEGQVLARSSTVLPCPAVPSGSLSGHHLPSFSMNLSPLEQFRQWLDLRKGVAEVLVAVEKPKLKASPVIQPWRPCNQVFAHLGMSLGCLGLRMENVLEHYDLLEVMEGTEKRSENDPEKSPWVRKSAQGYLLLRQALGSSQIRHIKPFQREPEKGPKAWAALKGVHAPATAAVAVVLERLMAALRIEEDEVVEEGVQKFFDLLTRLEGADLNYSELQKKTKVNDLTPGVMGIAVEGAEDEGEADLAATTSMEAAGVADTAATTTATDAVAADSTASATIVTRADICGAIASSSLMDGPLLKSKRVECQNIKFTVDSLETALLAAEQSIVAVGASRGDPRTPIFEGCSPSPLLPSWENLKSSPGR
ncbi:unnamed protein product [Closterium sp. NIES-53]